MHITGIELAAASTAVAALAVIGGLLGVKSSNDNALKIAREERSSKQKDDLDALKRATYAKMLSALYSVGRAKGKEAMEEALRFAQECLSELWLISPSALLRDLANETLSGALESTTGSAQPYNRAVPKLRAALLADLRGDPLPTPEELERIANDALTRQQRLGLPPSL